MRITAALQGDLERYMREELRDAERAVTMGVRATAEDLKRALRADAEAALGRRVSKSWRADTYPKRGESLDVASLVYTKAPELIRTFEEGATIKASSQRFLAIPTPSAPAQGVGRTRISPSTFPEHRFGPLRYVYVNRRLSLLVAENQRERKGKRGGYTLSRSKRALKTGYGLVSVPMFFLVPQVRLRPRLDVEGISRRETANLARNIDRAFKMLRARD